MATTTDCTALAQFVGTAPPWDSGVFGIVKLHVDMEDITSEKGITVSGSAADILQVWDIPVGTQIIGCLLDVTTACTDSGSATVAVGEATSAAGYLAATSIKSVAKTGMVLTDAFAAATKVYSATDTIDLVFGGTETDIDSGVFDVYLYCIFNPAVA